MPRDIRRRLEGLEERIPAPQQRPAIRPELRKFLDRYAACKAAGTLTPEDEATAAALRAEMKRRRDAGEIGGGVGS